MNSIEHKVALSLIFKETFNRFNYCSYFVKLQPIVTFWNNLTSCKFVRCFQIHCKHNVITLGANNINQIITLSNCPIPSHTWFQGGWEGGGGVLSLYPHLIKSLAYTPPKKNFGQKMGKFGKKWHFLEIFWPTLKIFTNLL